MNKLMCLIGYFLICRVAIGVVVPLETGGESVSYVFSQLISTSETTDSNDISIHITFSGDLLVDSEGYRIKFYADKNSVTPFYTHDFYHPGVRYPFSYTTHKRGNNSSEYVNWRSDYEGRIEIEMLSGSVSISGISVIVNDLSGGYHKQTMTVPEHLNVATTNGTPHTWLMNLGYSSDWELADLGDLDNDGFLNWQEYTADTNPNDSTDFLEVGISKGILSFDSSSSCLYSINYCDNLESRNWQLLTNNISGSGDVMTISPPHVDLVRYYQLEVQRPK